MTPVVAVPRMTTVAPTTVAACRQPIAAIAGSDVPRPIALIATSRPQVEASMSGALSCANADAEPGNDKAMLFAIQSATKTSPNTGKGTLAASLATERCVKNQPITSSTGNSRNTRNSFTITAVLPDGSD